MLFMSGSETSEKAMGTRVAAAVLTIVALSDSAGAIEAFQPTDTPPEVVVYLKPSGAKGDPWAAQAAALKKKYRVIPLTIEESENKEKGGRMDNGPSEVASSPPALTGEMLTKTLESRRISSCVLMASNGYVHAAIDAAIARPDLMRALVLVNFVPPEAVQESTPTHDGDDEGNVEWKDRLARLKVPVMAIFRADLMTGVGSAGQYLKASGLDAVDRIRARRIEGEEPILKTASASINPKLLAFLDDVRAGREISPETRQRLPSGLMFIDQVIGEGPSPREGQTIAARLRFRLPDGKDISAHGGMTPTWRFTYDRALTDGLFDGLASMRVGGRRKLYIPARMLKRQHPDPDRVVPDFVLDGQVETITADVYLVSVSDDPPPPARPRWSKSLEQDAGDGVRIVELKEGQGVMVEDTSIVTLASNLWAGSGHMPRYRSEINPDRGVLRDLNTSAKCLLPGVRGMRAGGERLIICAATTAFGAQLLPSIAPTDEIVFHVRVLDARPMPPPPHFDPIPPESYDKIHEKIWIKDLKTGEGATVAGDGALEFHYTMWRHDGQVLADSTILRDETVIEPFESLSGAFKQGLPGMRVGGIRQMRIQDPFGTGGKGLEPGEWVIYRVELVAVLSAQEAEARRHRDIGEPIRIDAETQKRIRM